MEELCLSIGWAKGKGIHVVVVPDVAVGVVVGGGGGDGVAVGVAVVAVVVYCGVVVGVSVVVVVVVVVVEVTLGQNILLRELLKKRQPCYTCALIRNAIRSLHSGSSAIRDVRICSNREDLGRIFGATFFGPHKARNALRYYRPFDSVFCVYAVQIDSPTWYN